MSKGLVAEEVPRWIIVLILLALLLIVIGIWSGFFFSDINKILGFF